jgi:ComEC/Rec2-related protein
LNSLFAAALIILICDPQQLFQSGFQLSFFVVLSIILLMPVFEKLTERIFRHDPLIPPELRTKWHPWISAAAWFSWETLLVSLAAWIGSLPLSAYYFNIVSPVSTPANLVAVPLCILVLISNIVALLFASWWPAAAAIFNHSGWAMMSLIAKTSSWFAAWPKAYAYVSVPSFYGACLFYIVLIAVTTGWLFKPRFRPLKLSALGVAAAIWAVLLFNELSTPTLTVLPLNDSNIVLYSAPFGRERALVNSGSAFASDFTLKPFLRAQGVNQLENLLLTHGEAHVASGASAVASTFDVKRIWISSVSGRPAAGYRRYLAGVDDSDKKVVKLGHGETNQPWTVLHPSSDDNFTRTEDAALVLYGNVRGTKVLLLSELTEIGQRVLIERHPELSADIVVAGMPGRGEPVIEPLLDVVRPKLIVIADPEAPATRRVTKALRERLAARKVPVIYTTESGAVTFKFTSAGWKVRTMN